MAGWGTNYPAPAGQSLRHQTLHHQLHQQPQDHYGDNQSDKSYRLSAPNWSGDFEWMGKTDDFRVVTPTVELYTVEDAIGLPELLALAQREIVVLKIMNAFTQSRAPTIPYVLERLAYLEGLVLFLTSAEFNYSASTLALGSVPERVHNTAMIWMLNPGVDKPSVEKNFWRYRSGAVDNQFIRPGSPLRAVCHISTRFDGDFVWAHGTGCLVENGRTVQTAGHLLYDGERGLHAAEIWVTIGYNGLQNRDENTTEHRRGLYAAVNLRYIDEKKTHFDFGIIRLEYDLSGVAPVPWRIPPSILSGVGLSIPQYPCDRPNTIDGGTQMWYSSGPIQDFDGSVLSYCLDTERGTSGAPLLANDGGEIVTIGVHSGHNHIGNYGVAIGYNGNDLIAISKAISVVEKRHWGNAIGGW